jgi:hypothetical protein
MTRFVLALVALSGLTVAGCSQVAGTLFSPSPAARALHYAPSSAVARPHNKQVFHRTGSLQVFTVPAGVTHVTIVAAGAQGGSVSSRAVGGYGAVVSGTFPVAAGEALYLEVGLHGGGAGGGGTIQTGAHGGAYSGVLHERHGGAVVLIIAGGGGGSGGTSHGYGSYGGPGGADGVDGGSGGCPIDGTPCGGGGGGGSQKSGGHGGAGVAGGLPGTSGVGGNGGAADEARTYGGGGGGAGWFGGGGGAANTRGGNAQGGGGGSSHVDSSATHVSFVTGGHEGAGEITISW